jgi:hypothetical protein
METVSPPTSCRSPGALEQKNGFKERSRQAKDRVYEARPLPAYNRAMNGITIYVDWAYFLGIVGTLIGIAYYANGRFTKIETTVEWLKEILLEIKERLEDGTGQPRHGRRRK